MAQGLLTINGTLPVQYLFLVYGLSLITRATALAVIHSDSSLYPGLGIVLDATIQEMYYHSIQHELGFIICILQKG